MNSNPLRLCTVLLLAVLLCGSTQVLGSVHQHIFYNKYTSVNTILDSQVSSQESSRGLDDRRLGESSSEDSVGKQKPLRVERVERIGAFSADTLETKYGLVRFEQGNGRYGFDLGAEKWYQKTTILDDCYKPFGKDYIAPWKLIPVGEQDEVIAKYEGRNISNLAKVRFASAPNSSAIPAEFDEGTKTWKLSLPATDANSSYDVFALYEGKVIGKLRVVSYPKQSYKLRLVPVNGQSVGDVSRLSQQLNDIYNKYGVSFTLYEGERMTAMFSSANLKAELKVLNKQYKQTHTLTSEDVCIFVVSEELSKGSKYEEVEGLMQRGKRFGYIFAGNSPNDDKLARTLAHELGHGLFTLGHTFDSDYNKGKRGVTKNLMDYAGKEATELAAYQWNIMAAPAPFTGFDRDKDAYLKSGASCMVLIGTDISNKILQSGKAVLSPAGDKIQFPSNTAITALFYEDSSKHPAARGSIAKFSIDQQHYSTYYRTQTLEFAHYKTERGDVFSPTISSQPPISIQIDKANHRITIEGEVFQIDRSSFSCEASESKTFSGQHFKIDRATQEKLAFGTREWDKAQASLEGQEVLLDKFVELVKGFDGGEAYLGEVIVDKLSVYQQRNGGKFVVVTEEVDFVSLNQMSWNAFAQEVFKRSGLGNRDILITIPRARAQTLLTDGVELNMPGLAYGSRVTIDTNKLSRDYDPTQKLARAIAGGKPSDVIAFVMDVFTHTKKKVVTHRGYFTPSRSITIITDTHRGAEVSGYPYNEAIIPYVQKGTDKLVSIVQARARQYNLRGRVVAEDKVTPQGLEVQRIEEEFNQSYIPIFEQLARDSQDLSSYEEYTVAMPIHYREGCISEKNKNGYENYKAYLLQYAYEDLLSELGATTRGGFSFQQEHTFTDKTDWYLSKYIDKPVYAALDGASVVLGFIGLDTAPDALNLFYSVARGHTLEASFAGANLLLVGPTALTALKYADELAKGAEITTRIVKAAPQPHGPRYVYYAPKTKQVYSDVVYKQPIQVGKEASSIAGQVALTGTAKLRALLGQNKAFVELVTSIHVKRPALTLDDFVKRFEELHKSALSQNAVKPLDDVVEDFNHLINTYLESFKARGKEQQMKDFINELMQTPDKFKAGATTLEVIRNPQKYISGEYHPTLSNMELEDVISYADDAGDFRFDIKWEAKKSRGREMYIFVDTKNYSRASNMFTDLGQFKAYLEKIDSFDQLYIIQQGGRGVTREQMIKRLRNELLKDKNLTEIFNIIRSKPQMNTTLLKDIEDNDIALEELTRLIKDPNSVIYTAILITK